MKERVGTESTGGSTEITPGGICGVTTSVEVLLHQQSKSLSTENSISSGPGDGLLDASTNATAASSPATLPFRMQSSQQQNQIFNLDVEGHGSCSSSAFNSQGASRASTLSLKKKKVNIATKSSKFQFPPHPKRDADIDSDLDLETAHETTALNNYSSRTTTPPADNYMTMSGTITRGKRAGQQADVRVNISREELELIESTHAKLKAEIEEYAGNRSVAGADVARAGKRGCCTCDLKRGLHIFLFSFICSPIVFLFASVYSFYMGTLTWYNVFSFMEEKPFLCRVVMAPLLIILYPIFILVATLGLGIYAAISQLTCHWFTWKSHVQDLEKGFYAWLCSVLRVEECSPYTEVVIVGQLNHIASPSAANAHRHDGL